MRADDDAIADSARIELHQLFEKLVATAGGPSKAARLLDVSRTTLDQWVKGKARIPLEPTILLARETGAGLDEIFRGRLPAKPPVASAANSWFTEGQIPVPMLRVRASAGPGLVAIDPEPDENLLSFREEWLRRMGFQPGHVEALIVAGESMEPTIRNGDMILVDRLIDRVVDGGLYVLVVGGEVRVKRILMRTNGDLVLKSDNPIWTDEHVPANDATDLIIEGRVRWFGRAI